MKKRNEVYGFKMCISKFSGLINIAFVLIIAALQNDYAQPERLTFGTGIRTDNSASFSPLELNPPEFAETEIRYSMLNPDTTIFQDTTASADTAAFPVETEVKLLPDRISFMENFLWGQNGFFRKAGIAAPLTPESRKNELEVRRTMLTAHLIGGITTLGLMLAASYYGQRIIDGHRNFRGTHQTLVAATIADYSLTALLAVLSPPPLIRRSEESTITIHKTLAWVHFAGMIVTPILGNMIGGRRNFNVSRAHVHQIAAYATTAVFASAMIVIMF